MSADVQTHGGDALSVPSHDLEIRDGGDRVRLEWRIQKRSVKARALFATVGDTYAVRLVALDAWAISQTPVSVPSLSVSLDSVPSTLLSAVRAAGYTPVRGDDE